MSNVLILEERNSSTVVNKSLDVGRETKTRRKEEQRIGNEEKQRKEEGEKKRVSLPIYIYIYVK